MLRTLGAHNRQLRGALLAEFAGLGAVAGLLAGVGASAIGWALAHFAFKIDYAPSPAIFVVGLLAGIGGVMLAD